MQSTLHRPASFVGTGLHSGRPVRLRVHPAPADHGIWFCRTDVPGSDRMLPALWHRVELSPLCTRLVGPTGVAVSTIEHLMAALSGLGVQNALVEVDGPEVPILDGSAAPFVRGLLEAGIKALDAPLMALQVLKPVEVREGASMARLEPADALRIAFEIDFDEPGIGRQALELDIRNGSFVRELCDSRTFCRQADVDAMRAGGLALGGSLGNAVVFQRGVVLSPGGLRHPNEPVRHKMLDAVGDLALAGAPILGRYVGLRAGHAMTNRLLRRLYDTPDAWTLVECAPETELALPGIGVSDYDLALCA